MMTLTTKENAMEIFRIIGIGFIGTVLVIFMKEHRADLAILISFATIALIFITITPYFGGIIIMLENIGNRLNVDLTHINIVIRVIGIAYITQFAAEISRDAGAGSIATNIEIGGKIVLMILSMPIIYSLIDTVMGIL